MMRTSYFSLDNMPIRSDCEKLLREYKVNNKISKGAYGTIYEVCKDKNCNFVLKTMEFCKSKYEMIGVSKLSYNTKYNEWIKEIDNHLKIIECQKSYEFKFVPYIYDAWFCNEKNGDAVFYIVMEKFDGDLKYLIKKFSNHSKEDNFFKSFIILKLKVLAKSLEHINNSCKICLDDIKLENILYKKNDDNTYDLVFSDFGTSIIHSNETCIKTDIDRFRQTVNEFNEKF